MRLSKSFFLLALAFVSLCVAAGAAVVALTADEKPGVSIHVAVVASALAVFLLWREAKRDLDAVLTLVCSFALITAVCVGIYLLSATAPGPAPKLTLAASIVVGVTTGVATYRRQRSESRDFPNVLAGAVPATSIFEDEGVQFTGLMDQGGGGKPHRISILLQNCFNASRRVTIRFDAAGAAKYLRFHPEHTVELGAAEVSRVVFPVVSPTYPGEYPLYFSIAVRDGGGTRVRPWRAQEATDRTKASTTAALLAVGHLKVGGGVRFIIGPLPDDIWARELMPPQEEVLWKPRIGTVPLVQSMA